MSFFSFGCLIVAEQHSESESEYFIDPSGIFFQLTCLKQCSDPE